MEGNTILPGIDDYPAATEVTTLHDAHRLKVFADRVGLVSCRSGQSSVTTAGAPVSSTPTSARGSSSRAGRSATSSRDKPGSNVRSVRSPGDDPSCREEAPPAGVGTLADRRRAAVRRPGCSCRSGRDHVPARPGTARALGDGWGRPARGGPGSCVTRPHCVLGGTMPGAGCGRPCWPADLSGAPGSCGRMAPHDRCPPESAGVTVSPGIAPSLWATPCERTLPGVISETSRSTERDS